MSESYYTSLADIIGSGAAALVLSSFVPQIIKAYKTKKMYDVSIYLMILIASGMLLWVVYGILRNDIVLIGANAAGVALSLILIGLKVIYDRRSTV